MENAKRLRRTAGKAGKADPWHHDGDADADADENGNPEGGSPKDEGMDNSAGRHVDKFIEILLKRNDLTARLRERKSDKGREREKERERDRRRHTQIADKVENECKTKRKQKKKEWQKKIVSMWRRGVVNCK